MGMELITFVSVKLTVLQVVNPVQSERVQMVFC